MVSSGAYIVSNLQQSNKEACQIHERLNDMVNYSWVILVETGADVDSSLRFGDQVSGIQ
jgi:hypothetical protein